MRKMSTLVVLTLIVFLGGQKLSFSQNDNNPNQTSVSEYNFINHDALWYLLTVEEGPNYNERFSFMWFERDSLIIDNHFYYPLIHQYEDTKIKEIVGFFREDGTKMYKYTDDKSREYINGVLPLGEHLYFNNDGKVGDTLVHFGEHYEIAKIINIKTYIDLSGKERKQWVVDCDEWGEGHNFIIEGIGDVTDGLLAPQYLCTFTEHTRWIVCYSENGEMMYHNDLLHPSCQTTVSTQNILNNTIKVFPNPTSGLLHIDGIYRNVQAKIYSSQGVILKSTELSKNLEWDVSDLSSGLYILELIDGEISQKIKWVVAH